MSVPLEKINQREEFDDCRSRGVQIIIAVNGPGEVACWLFPLLPVLRRRLPEARICVALLPCVFSTGAEYDLIRKRPEVDAVLTKKETMALVLKKSIPLILDKGKPGFVLHLGGDPVLTWLLARRLGQACLAYLEKNPGYPGLFSRIFYSGFAGKPKAGRQKRDKVVGDMMVDAAWMRCGKRAQVKDGRLIVGLYPGSRDYIARFVLPFFAAVSEITAVSCPEVEWLLAKSDFLSWDLLKSLKAVDDGRPIEGVGLTYMDVDGGEYLLTPKGLRIRIMKAAEVAGRIRLALTLPGSNTAELSALGIPMLVTIPSWQAERIPWPGLAGHIGRIPVIGKYLKRLAGRIIYRRIGYAAHPNRRAGHMVVPELVGHIRACEVSAKLVEMLGSDLRPMENEIKEIMGNRGAAERLVSELITFLQDQQGIDEGCSAS